MLTHRLSRKQSWQSKFILEQKTYTSTNTNAAILSTHKRTQTHTSKINILTHSKLHLFTPWYDVWFEMYTTGERKEKWKTYMIWGRNHVTACAYFRCQKQQTTLHYQNKAHLSNVAKYLSLFLLRGKEITHRGGKDAGGPQNNKVGRKNRIFCQMSL